ncbi:MAG: hypothetical protein ACYDHY_09595 [Acidiferrobacterales bacterium]
MSKFETAVKEAAEKAVLKIISDGSWVAPDYANRFKLPPEMMNEIWGMVDQESLKKKMAARLEQELADRIVNHLAAEIATDVKQILSVQERREALRHLARQHLEGIMSGQIVPTATSAG